MSTSTKVGFSVDVPLPYEQADARTGTAQGGGLWHPHRDRCAGDDAGEARRRLPPLRDPRRVQPLLAHRALQAEPDAGLLLPCNVVVAELGEGGSRVSFMDPVAILAVLDSSALDSIAADAAERLHRVAAALEN